MRAWVLSIVTAAACAASQPPALTPDVRDTMWRTVRGGDVIVAVPGTGGYTGLGSWIDAAAASAASATPVVSERANPHLNPIVLEQAIAVAQRAGFSDSEIESGAVALALWGAGVTHATTFRYESLGGLRVTFAVIGGESVCAVGMVFDNLGNYTAANADKDARDLYARAQAFAGSRAITVVAHSWGGAVAEHLAQNLATIRGALGGDAPIPFVVAAGVPGLVVGDRFYGAGVYDSGDGLLYETDRPDDPVHALDPSGNISGHQYDIMFGDVFRGSYGITTTALSCDGVPGPCAQP